MGPGYDIFRELENGEVLWVGCAKDLDDAKKLVAQVSATASRYFVRSASTGEIVANVDAKKLGGPCA